MTNLAQIDIFCQVTLGYLRKLIDVTRLVLLARLLNLLMLQGSARLLARFQFQLQLHAFGKSRAVLDDVIGYDGFINEIETSN